MEVALARREGYYYEKEEESLRHPSLTPSISSSSSSSSFWVSPLGFPSPLIEREHMFNKVVTPSDVGKLNRLVIPKQHAEKHFPLDLSSESKSLLLCFDEGITGKPWRFRYSYWNSSQSYVMTKGWSRFVKEKHLAAGDTVSFARGIGGGGRLFIDWTRRSPKPRRLPLPTLHPMMPLRSVVVPWGGVGLPMVLDSVPVVRGKAAKRVRLFGVTLECSEPEKEHLDPGGFSSQRLVQPRGELEPCVELGL